MSYFIALSFIGLLAGYLFIRLFVFPLYGWMCRRDVKKPIYFTAPPHDTHAAPYTLHGSFTASVTGIYVIEGREVKLKAGETYHFSKPLASK